MADVKYFEDLTPLAIPADSKIMAFESEPRGPDGFKTTALELKDYVNSGKGGGKTIAGGDATTEILLLRNNAVDTLGFDVNGDGSLTVNAPNYELLVTGDDDIPNKKYVDDSHPDTVTEVLTISGDGQTAFTLGTAPVSPSEAQLVLNGQIRLYTDFTVSGTTLTWNDPGGLTLKTTDTLQIWYNINGGVPAAPVTSVFGRVGVVTTQPSDYDASQVDNDSGVSGTFVSNALNTLDTDISNHTTAANPHSGSAASGANSDLTSLSGLTTPLSIAQGGTNSGSVLANGKIMQSSGGAVVESSVDISSLESTTLYIQVVEPSVNLGNGRYRLIPGTGSHRLSFQIPDDFASWATNGCKIQGVVGAGAATSGRDIDYAGEYGAVIGEAYNNTAFGDSTSTYDFTGKANQNSNILDFTTQLSGVSAGDKVNVFIDNNSIGAPGIYFTNFALNYNR